MRLPESLPSSMIFFFRPKFRKQPASSTSKSNSAKAEKDLLDHMKQNGEEKPSLIIFDMNNANAKPLTLIPKLKSKLKKGHRSSDFFPTCRAI